MLRLRTLGGLALECDGTRLESVAGRRRALALLAQMAVAGPHGVSRSRLVHRLWPDSDEDKARNVLAQTLHKLKREIGGAEIVTGTNELRLDDALISSDVGEFERHASDGLLEPAARLYDGPFLDGFYVNGADEFERWAEDERSRLARLAGETFEALAHQADRAGDVGMAVTWWRRLTTLDPLATRATLGLMTALAASGDTADSLRVGSVYQALVRNELGAAPTLLSSAWRTRFGAERWLPLADQSARGKSRRRQRSPRLPGSLTSQSACPSKAHLYRHAGAGTVSGTSELEPRQLRRPHMRR